MESEFIDYSKLMNNAMFKIYVQDYYSPRVSPYFTGMRPPLPMLDGREVSVEEYNNTPGVTELADDTLIRHAPIRVGSDYDMTISMVSPATIVDMLVNGIVFEIVELNDIKEILNIMWNYQKQVEPYASSNRTVKAYLQKLQQATHLLVQNQQQRQSKADNIARSQKRENGETFSLSEMVGVCF